MNNSKLKRRLPEVPNTQTAKQLADSRIQINRGKFYRFNSNEKALNFLFSEFQKGI